MKKARNAQARVLMDVASRAATRDAGELLDSLEGVDGPEVLSATEVLLDLRHARERRLALEETERGFIGRLKVLAAAAALNAPTASERLTLAEQALTRIEARATRISELQRRAWALDLNSRRRRYTFSSPSDSAVWHQAQYGARAVAARRRAGLTIADAARAIGVGAKTLRRLEEGLSSRFSAYVVKAAGVYGCSVGDLFNGDDATLDLDLVESIIAGLEAKS